MEKSYTVFEFSQPKLAWYTSKPCKMDMSQSVFTRFTNNDHIFFEKEN
jgi:hypothetical protein